MEEFDLASEEKKKEFRECTAQELKAVVQLYLHERTKDKDHGDVLFNLLKGVAKEAGFKEQRGGTNYINGEFGTNFYSVDMPPKEEREKDVFYTGEVIRIGYETMADEEEIENIMEE
jgi:hypothetical protein